MTNAPLFFDVVTQQREDQHGKTVLQTLVGIGNVPIMHRVAEIEDLEDAAAISTLGLKEREQISRDFGFAFRELFIALEAANQAKEQSEALEPASA